MRVDLERVREIQKERARINAVPLASIELYSNGERVAIDAKDVTEWTYTGLSNWDFLARDGCKRRVKVTGAAVFRCERLQEHCAGVTPEAPFDADVRGYIFERLSEPEAMGVTVEEVVAELRALRGVDITPAQVQQIFDTYEKD